MVVVVDYEREKEVEGRKGKEDKLGKREPTSCALNDIKQRSPNRFVILSGFGVGECCVGVHCGISVTVLPVLTSASFTWS